MRKVKRLDGLSDRVRQLLYSWQGTQGELAEGLDVMEEERHEDNNPHRDGI